VSLQATCGNFGTLSRDGRYESLAVTKVNSLARVYHWQGSDNSLLPILLTAHLGNILCCFLTCLCLCRGADVVPVDSSTLAEWVHPPYSGHYDGTLSSMKLLALNNKRTRKAHGFGVAVAAMISQMWFRFCTPPVLSGCNLSQLKFHIRTTVDALLKHNFVPRRTVVLAFGIDEEASGREVCHIHCARSEY
jgi:Gly-Xaa carboxypeptidase